MRSRRTGRKRWRSDATGISQSRASLARWSQKCRSSSDVMTPHENAPESTGRILVVDDHEDNIELLRARLEAWGYEVDAAHDGAQALEIVHRAPPDLILLDVMMPSLDGNEVARRVKHDRALPFIPIIMQTALDSTENKVEGLEAGADDYITKPIEFAELKARLRSMLRIKRLQEELEERERQLLEANERLKHMSRTDALTGLENRRATERQLELMFAHSKRYEEPLSCVMCDLDRFKSVNDEHGHHAGNAVLKQFAAILKRAAREIDAVGRYGGEEFIVLLPGTPLDAATTFSERLREQIERANHEYYVLDQPTLSDQEYDKLFRELRTLEEAHPTLRTADSPTLRVGAEPQSALAKHQHLVPMLSLANTFNVEELEEWERRLVRLAGDDVRKA